MSLHTVVTDLFTNEIAHEYTDVRLSNADVNRIVTNTVQSFSVEEDSKTFIAKNIRDYVAKYKAPKQGGCGCGK